MADGKKKRSLREAFGVVRSPEGTSATGAAAEETAGRPPAASPVGAPEGGKPAPADEGKAEKENPAPRRTRRASSGPNGSNGARAGRRDADADTTGDPVNTASRGRTRSGGRGRGEIGSKGAEKSEEVVPGKGGKMVPAETPVNMTFTVTAKERYLWTLELKRRGLTAVGVLRETMEAMVGEEPK